MAKLGRCCGDQLASVNDAVCCTIAVEDGVEYDVWDDATNYIINGTIMVENNGLAGISPAASLEVNGAVLFTVDPGSCRSVTVDDINEIDLIGVDGTGTSNVTISFSLNYRY